MQTALTTSFDGPLKKDWIVFIFLSIVWGSSFILIKYALLFFNPIQVGSLRLLISSVAFIPIFIYHFKKIDWSKWYLFLLVGICGSGLPSFLFPMAQTHLSSTIAGILNTLTPLFTLIIGFFIFRNKATNSKIMGVVIGFIGAIILIAFGEKLKLDRSLIFGLYIVLATLCYGTSVNVVSSNLKSINPTLLSSVSFTLLIPFALVVFFLSGTPETIVTDPEIWRGVVIVSVLSLLGTFLASILFYNMVQRTNAVFGSSVTYMIPVVSTIWGIADGELFTLVHLIGASLILIGVYLSRKK